MRLARHRHLDALCGEYLLGTLRGRARSRFERALREEPLVAKRLHLLSGTYMPTPSDRFQVTPRPDGLARLRRELQLDAAVRRPWYARLAPLQWSGAAVAALALAVGIGLTLLRPGEPTFTAIAQLSGDAAPAVTAALSEDRRQMQLRATRAQRPAAGLSYELWLIPAEGGAPLSLGTVEQLDARIRLSPAQSERLREGARLAISVEPAGGSPTGSPTGPVILVGPVS